MVCVRWFELRKESEDYFGIPVVSNACIKGRYQEMSLRNITPAYVSTTSSHTQVKAEGPFQFINDRSPDSLLPMKSSRFLDASLLDQ